MVARLARRVLLVALLLAGAAGEALARRVALVVGAGDYQHVGKLANAVNDAADMAAKLRETGFEVELVTDPDRGAMEQALQAFGERARGAEAALFFYAGHAIQVQGRNWLIPVSAELRNPQQLRFQAIELEAITEQTQAAAGVSLIILDACRDNPFRTRWPAAFREISGVRGLGRVAPPTGSLVLFSAAAGEVAEDGTGRNSPFTEALLRHLPTPGLEVRAMVGEVRRAVMAATGQRQVPEEWSSLTGSFYFVRPAAAPVPPPAPPPAPAPVAPVLVPAPVAMDAIVWPTIANSRNPADFEHFLEQFPASPIAPFARNRLEELRREAAAAARPPAPPRLLTEEEAREAQRLLAAMGFEPGVADGIITAAAREALRAFAIAAELPPGLGFTTQALEALRRPPPAAGRRASGLSAVAIMVLATGDAPGALRLARASLAIQRNEGASLVAGQAAERMGRIEEARRFYLAAQEDGAPQAAGLLAALPAPQPPPPPPVRQMTREEVQEAQRILTNMGFQTGNLDGWIGLESVEALRAFAAAIRRPALTEFTTEALAALRAPVPPRQDRIDALRAMAEEQLRLGNPAAALRLARGALRIGADGAANLVAGDAAQRIGDTEAAREHFSAARGLGQAGAEARLAALAVPPAPVVRQLTQQQVLEAQRLLANMGFEPDLADGTLRPRSREALRAFAIAAGLPPNLDFTTDALNALRSGAPSVDRRAAALAMVANEALEAGNPADALRLARASIWALPNIAAYLTGGDAGARLGMLTEARQLYQGARTLGASDVDRRLAALAVPRPPPPQPAPPPVVRALTFAEIQEAQRLLTAMGFSTAGVDGMVGPASREALRAFAIAANLPETLDYTTEALDRLRAGAPPPERRAAALATLGRRALGANDAAGARRLANASLQIRQDGETQLLLGDAAQRLGDMAAARTAFEAAQRAGVGAAGGRLAALPAPGPPLPAPLTQRASASQRGWVFDSRNGCAAWNRWGDGFHAATVTWSGGCNNGVATGAGTLILSLSDGRALSFTGELRIGQAQGRGSLLFPDRTRYEGEFSNGELQGQGSMQFAGGIRYEGGFRTGRAHGFGARHAPGRPPEEGSWTDGCLWQGATLVAWVGLDISETQCRAQRR